MNASHESMTVNHRLQRIILWCTAVLYTACLPYVNFAYRSIVKHFSPQVAGRVPLFIIIILAAIYSTICIKKKRTLRCLIVLAVSGIIVILVMNFEANANKYIHIPEYFVLSWILYHALALDYRGSGMLLLVFICAAMLGVVDEIMQGMHPQRTYGGTDMIIDAAAGFIGCLSIMGLKKPARGGWAWCRNFRHLWGSLAVIFFGAATAVPMGSILFDVRNQGNFGDVYPRWLLAGSALFVAAGIAVTVFHWRYRQNDGSPGPEIKPSASAIHTTATLWIICPLAILMTMHALVLWVAVAGIDFR